MDIEREPPTFIHYTYRERYRDKDRDIETEMHHTHTPTQYLHAYTIPTCLHHTYLQKIRTSLHVKPGTFQMQLFQASLQRCIVYMSVYVFECMSV